MSHLNTSTLQVDCEFPFISCCIELVRFNRENGVRCFLTGWINNFELIFKMPSKTDGRM